MKEARDELIQVKLRRLRSQLFGFSHVDATAFAEFHPVLVCELAVTGADGVGMKMEAPRQIARTREPLSAGARSPLRILRTIWGNELVANADFAGAREPEAHAGVSYRGRRVSCASWFAFRGVYQLAIQSLQ